MGWFTEIAVPLGGAFASAYVDYLKTGEAEEALESSTGRALTEQQRQFDLERADSAEQRAISDYALQRLQGMAEGTVGVEDIPGYDFRRDEGNKAIERMRAAGGTFLSGRTAKELMRYGSDYAASEYQNEWARLAQLAGLGAPGVGVGGAPSTNISNIYGQQGVNQANIAGVSNRNLQGTIANVVDAFNRSQTLGRLGTSDRRVKKNISTVGVLDNGLPVYSFQYITGGPQQIGLMAQDVEKVNPSAVVEIDGIKHVNYSEAVR